MLLKGIGICILAISSAMFGYALSSDYTERIKNLEQFNQMLMFLMGEIKHSRLGIKEALFKISMGRKDIVGSFLKSVCERMEGEVCSINEAWNFGISKILMEEGKFSQEDLQCISDLGKNLGITDRETQINNLLNTMNIMEVTISNLNKSKGERCRLYRTLGVMGGVFMAVVLI